MKKPPPKAWAPIPVAVQIARHKAALAAAAKAAKVPQSVKTARHLAAVKAAKSRKAAAVKRQWSPDSSLPLCSARAVAEAFRIASGSPVSLRDVADLFRCAGGDADTPVSILAALAAAPAVLGSFPVLCGSECDCVPLILGISDPQPHAVVQAAGVWWSWGEPFEPWTDVVEEAWAVTWQR